MKLLSLSARDLRAAVPMRDAVAVVRDSFVALSTGRASSPQRGVVEVPDADGTTLVMGAHVPALGLCSKVVSVFHRNPGRGLPVVHGLVVVLDPETGAPVALCDGTFATAWRTGAGSGVATDLLARPDASVGAVIGCGAQARTQVLGIDAVRDLEVIRVFGRRTAAAEELVAECAPHARARLEVVDAIEPAVGDADVVCVATNSRDPVLHGAWLKPGAHVNAVGSFTPEMSELDVEVPARASVFVDSVAAAVAEAGDLLAAERAGATCRDRLVEIGAVAAGLAEGRGTAEQITLFKSVGQAVQDVAVTARACAVARARGLGVEVEL